MVPKIGKAHMKIKKYESPIGDNKYRFRTVVETEECAAGTIHSRIIRQELIRYVYEDPYFSQCGGLDFQKAHIWHDGSKWMAEFEASGFKGS